MKKPIFWIPEYQDIIDELPFGVWFDYWEAETPEMAILPISYWTRERFLAYFPYCKDLSDEAREKLPLLRRVDMRVQCLKKVGVVPRGRPDYIRKDMRKYFRMVPYYALDIDNINALYSSPDPAEV